jgi:hypothetical protein
MSGVPLPLMFFETLHGNPEHHHHWLIREIARRGGILRVVTHQRQRSDSWQNTITTKDGWSYTLTTWQEQLIARELPYHLQADTQYVEGHH